MAADSHRHCFLTELVLVFSLVVGFGFLLSFFMPKNGLSVCVGLVLILDERMIEELVKGYSQRLLTDHSFEKVFK